MWFRRLPLAFALSVAGCAAKTGDAAPLPVPTTTAPAALVAPSAAPPPPLAPLPSFDELAARQVRLAPGMRELQRGETAADVALLKVERDTCVRVVFAGQRPADVALVAKDGTALATATAATEGVLDARGPVCFRAGAEPRVAVKGDGGTVRFVVWGAP